MYKYLENLSLKDLQDFILNPNKTSNKAIYEFYNVSPLAIPTTPPSSPSPQPPQPTTPPLVAYIPSILSKHYGIKRYYPNIILQQLEEIRSKYIDRPISKDDASTMVNIYIYNDTTTLDTPDFCDIWYNKLLSYKNLKIFDILEPFNEMFTHFANIIIESYEDDLPKNSLDIIYSYNESVDKKKNSYTLLRKIMYNNSKWLRHPKF